MSYGEELKGQQCCGCGATFEDSVRRGWSTPVTWQAGLTGAVLGVPSKFNFCSPGCAQLWLQETDPSPVFNIDLRGLA